MCCKQTNENTADVKGFRSLACILVWRLRAFASQQMRAEQAARARCWHRKPLKCRADPAPPAETKATQAQLEKKHNQMERAAANWICFLSNGQRIHATLQTTIAVSLWQRQQKQCQSLVGFKNRIFLWKKESSLKSNFRHSERGSDARLRYFCSLYKLVGGGQRCSFNTTRVAITEQILFDFESSNRRNFGLVDAFTSSVCLLGDCDARKLASLYFPHLFIASFNMDGSVIGWQPRPAQLQVCIGDRLSFGSMAACELQVASDQKTILGLEFIRLSVCCGVYKAKFNVCLCV